MTDPERVKCVLHKIMSWFIDQLNNLKLYLCITGCRVFHLQNTNSDIRGSEFINVSVSNLRQL